LSRGQKKGPREKKPEKREGKERGLNLNYGKRGILSPRGKTRRFKGGRGGLKTDAEGRKQFLEASPKEDGGPRKRKGNKDTFLLFSLKKEKRHTTPYVRKGEGSKGRARKGRK